MRHALPCLALLAAICANPVFAQSGAVPNLEGHWSNGFLTALERPPKLKSLIVSDDEARAFEAAHTGKPSIAGDTVGQDETEFWEMGLRLARIDGKARASWIVEPTDGLLPYSEAGKVRVQAAQASYATNFDGPETRPPAERCLLGSNSKMGPPMLNTAYSNIYQIVQTPDHVLIHTEAVHDVRIIRLNDRRHLPPEIRPWMGDSIGWWEGQTLVVETTNPHPGDTLRFSGRLYLSPNAKVVERFTRKSATELRYDFTVEDPQMFTMPWRGEQVFEASTAPLLPYDCHEGNYSLRNVLAGARQEEARKAAGE